MIREFSSNLKRFNKLAAVAGAWFGLAALLGACGSENGSTVTPGPSPASTRLPDITQPAPAITAAATVTTSSTLTATTTTTNPVTAAATVTGLPVQSGPTALPSPVRSTTAPPATATPMAGPAPAPTITPLPANLPPRYIDALRSRTYQAGDIKLDRLYEQNAAYTANLIYYQSDNLRISGLMMVPAGPKDKKYPVALINHGYFNPPEYDSGWDTLRELRYFARNGFITIASDYRNYARSDKGDNDREPGYAIDILNLIEAAKRLPQADPSKITIMGHSMGGEIALNLLVVSKDVKVAALFGSMSADAADNFYARLKWRGGDTTEKRIYGDPAQNQEAYRRMSPLSYFADITAPVIIHVGTNDTTTPPAWSEKIFAGLKNLNKPSEYYTYSGQGHSLNGAAFDSAMSRTLSFFNKALGR